MPTKFFTNQGGNSLLKKFEGVLTHIESIRHFDALVGYFRASGYFRIRPFLTIIPKIRILVGINVDTIIKEYHQKGQLYLENPKEAIDSFLDETVQNIQEAEYDEVTENGTHTKILVVVPPAIEDNWRRTTKEFELDNHFWFITTGSLHKILNRQDYTYPNPEEFDLIVVDESHKFRNDYTEMYIALQEICKMPRIKPAENGDARKKIILISATPLNNRPQDIENQLYLFQDRRNSTLENIRNLQEYFKPINEKYKKLSSEKKLNIPKLKALFQKLRDDVVEPLVIRRTRTDIENNEDYLEDLRQQQISFPKVSDPICLCYQLDETLSKLFFDSVTQITGLDEAGNEAPGLGYYRYRAIEFLLRKEAREIYGNVGSISERLAGIMRILLVKRLESSFFAFTRSIIRLQRAINNMISMFEQDRIFIAPDLDINKLLEEGLSYDQIEARINEKGGNNKEYKTDDFSKEFMSHLKSDKVKIDGLVSRWEAVTYDPKLEEFSDHIRKEFFNKKRNQSSKLVIFSESKETAEELTSRLAQISTHNVLTISAENRKSNEHTIRENFDANLDKNQWKNDFQILITTEVLAEGINLHRSNIIVNYDVPWNSTRLMQRIGRVNRIGTRADQIFVYNYYPSAHGDAQINLVNTALRKLQAFHTAFGEDNKIFSVLEEKGEGALFGNKIQKEESEVLKYLNELREFKKTHPSKFDEISRIPNKSRCGRKVTTDDEITISDTVNNDIHYPLANSSVSFLKSDNHPGVFCFITPDLNVIELTFLHAAAILKASEKEASVKLRPNHYKQIQSSLTFFTSEKTQLSLKTVSRRNLSPAENKAITNIQGLLKLVPTEQKRMALLRLLELIKRGTYPSKGLPKYLNDFFASHKFELKEPLKFFDLLFSTLLDNYDLSLKSDPEYPETTIDRGIINPRIVLSQSFYEKE